MPNSCSRRRGLVFAVGVAAIGVLSAVPARAAGTAHIRTEQFAYHNNWLEFFTGSGELFPNPIGYPHAVVSVNGGCNEGSNCFSLAVEPGERTVTLTARNENGGPAFLNWGENSPPYRGGGGCGTVKVAVSSRDVVIVRLTDPLAGWYEQCTQGTDGYLTATFR